MKNRISTIFSMSKLNTKEGIKKVGFYLTAFLIPFFMLLILRLIYNNGIGNPLTGTLSIPLIFWNGIASSCFLYYVRHTKSSFITHIYLQFILAFAYGLCSYGIIQESSVSTLFLYAIFPLLFLSVEKMLSGNSRLPFFVLGSLALIWNPECAIPLTLLLTIFMFIELKLNHKLSFAEGIHTLGCVFLIALVAAFRIFPHLESMYDIASTYEGFTMPYSPFVFLSRFFPCSSPSISFYSIGGVDLYFGLIFLFLFALFFFLRTVSGKKRIFYGIYTLTIIAVLSFSPLRYAFNLFAESVGLSASYSFILVFWCLRLSMVPLSQLSKIHKTDFLSCSVLFFLMTFFLWLVTFQNFPAFAFPAILVCLAIWIFLFYKASNFATPKKPIQILSICLLLLEMTCNAFISTNLDFLPSGRNISALYPWDNPAIISTEKSAVLSDSLTEDAVPSDSLNGEELYVKFSSSHSNEELIDLLTTLTSSVPLERSEWETYTGKALPNQMELFNGLCHKAGSSEDLFIPVSTSVSFTNSDSFTITPLSDGIYNFSQNYADSEEEYFYVPFQLQLNDTLSGDLYIYNNFTSEFFRMTVKQQTEDLSGYLRFTNIGKASPNFQILTYTVNEDMAENLPELIDSYTTQHTDTSSLYIFVYVGISLTCVGILIMMSLYFNRDKQQVYNVLYSFKETLSRWKFPKLFSDHIKRNYVYYLSFFIPLLVFLTGMIITNSTPFGNTSLFDEDGISLTLPNFLDYYYNLKDGNVYMSMNGGYGSNIYALNPSIQLYYFFKLFSPEHIAPFLLLSEALCLGLCGVAMVFYMTHRLHGKRALKGDYRLLIPALVYSLNGYMLAMHNYTTWYITLLALPLLIVAMDYLMYKKKTLPYVLLLTYCIITNLYLALYLCIFLVIYFFTCKFDSFSDFIKKGIRFALCSLLAAGNSFFVISNTLLSSYDSVYNTKDSVFPSIGLHTSFLEQWKKHMIFSPTLSVSSDNGMLNIYCGILTLLLVLIYICSKQISRREKLRKVLPLLLLYISFNEQVLSYIWNGLHYQTKVPNRFVFLALFLLAELSYDGFSLLRKASVVKYTVISLVLSVFFLVCQFFSQGNTSLAWIATLALCGLYLVLYLFFKQKHSSLYPKLLVVLLTFELCANGLYTMSHYAINNIRYWGDYVDIGSFINDDLEDPYGYFRVSFPTSLLANEGQIYHTGSNSLFNSFVSLHQNNLNTLLGFYSSGNLISSNYDGTPFGMSLSSSRYLFLPLHATGILRDLDQYEYIGQINYYYVYENKNACSLGYFAPMEIETLEDVTFIPEFCNIFSSLYTKDDTPLYIVQRLTYNEDPDAFENFYFTDDKGNILSFEEAEKLYELEHQSSSTSSCTTLRIHLNYTPAADGHVYLCSNELVGLGNGTAFTSETKDIAFPNSISSFDKEYYFIVMNKEVLQKFYEKVQMNQLENIQIGNDTITGTTNYSEDGYTLFSLAHDRNWHAYIDGVEVDTEDFCSTFLLVKTPAGKHTLELKYIPYGMKVSKGITLGFWVLTMIIFTIAHFVNRRKTLSQS